MFWQLYTFILPNQFNKSSIKISDSDAHDADRYSPDNDIGPAIYELTEQRLRTIRSKLMYWYFDKGGDRDRGDYQTDIHNSMPQIHKNFNFQLPFFGFRLNYTRVRNYIYLKQKDFIIGNKITVEPRLSELI